jgi:alpha-L-rhamnosidase
MRRKIRSWLYQVDQEATTIWERWDAIREDGSIHKGEMSMSDAENNDGNTQSPSMISFNHYAYGAVIDWVYRNVAGISPTLEGPGYRQFTFAPRPGVGFDYASASIDTPLGKASIAWEIVSDGSLSASVDVPFGAVATVDFPVTGKSLLRVNGRQITNGSQLTHGRHYITLTNPEVVQFTAAI